MLNVDDVIETANHFRCIDMIIDNAKGKTDREIHQRIASDSEDRHQ